MSATIFLIILLTVYMALGVISYIAEVLLLKFNPGLKFMGTDDFSDVVDSRGIMFLYMAIWPFLLVANIIELFSYFVFRRMHEYISSKLKD